MKHGGIVGMAIKIHELVIYETTEEARSLRISSKIGYPYFLGCKLAQRQYIVHTIPRKIFISQVAKKI